MRRAGVLIIGAWAAVVGLAPAASAAPAAAGPETVCTVSDPALIELSGLVAQSDGGYVVVNDSNNEPARMKIFFLDSRCRLAHSTSYPAGNPARDPEDLAVASNGTLWVADTGDNLTTPANQRRQTVALWRVPSGGTPSIYRLTYPDGAHDAEALLLGPDDTPVIVTKDPSGTAGIYQPERALEEGTRQGVPLRKVGTFKAKQTGTANPLGSAGASMVTGAAQSPDRKRCVLRTYSDAYEWDVAGGDVVKAITTGTPRITPLADEPQGEAIAYTPDGQSLLTLSDQTGAAKLLKYQRSTGVATAPKATTAPKTDDRSWVTKLTLPQIIDIVAGVGVLGLILVVVGVVGIRNSRKNRDAQTGAGGRDGDADDDSGGWAAPPPGGRGRAADPPVRRGTTYGGGPQSGAAPGHVVPPPTVVHPPGGGPAGSPSVPPSGAQPGYGGNVYGGGRGPSGYDGGNGHGGGRQQYPQPGYHPGDRY